MNGNSTIKNLLLISQKHFPVPQSDECAYKARFGAAIRAEIRKILDYETRHSAIRHSLLCKYIRFIINRLTVYVYVQVAQDLFFRAS